MICVKGTYKGMIDRKASEYKTKVLTNMHYVAKVFNIGTTTLVESSLDHFIMTQS